MTAMSDVRCGKCGRRYGYQGEPLDCPPCPKCGATPPHDNLKHDQGIIDEFRSFLAEWATRKQLARPGRVRMAAGLTKGQAAKITGIERHRLHDIESGVAEPTVDESRAMAEAYGIA
jgi:DNA-binding XRE family transcriptional regulator